MKSQIENKVFAYRAKTQKKIKIYRSYIFQLILDYMIFGNYINMWKIACPPRSDKRKNTLLLFKQRIYIIIRYRKKQEPGETTLFHFFENVFLLYIYIYLINYFIY